MRKDKLVKLIKEIYGLNNEQESRQKLEDIDLLIEELFKYMEENEIKSVKIGEYINLEIGIRKGRDFENPRTKEKCILPDKFVRKIKPTKKVKEI